MKNLKIGFMISLLIFGQGFAEDMCDALGRTKLINYIIAQESNLARIKNDVDNLWHVCFTTRRYSDGVRVTINNHRCTNSFEVEPEYRYETVRRASCTDADIYAYKKALSDLNYCIMQTIYEIRSMALSQDLCINAKDISGKSAQNYCYTYEIYQELRCQGAEFQYMPYMYFNPVCGTLLTAAGVLGTGYAIGLTAALIHYSVTR